MDVLTQDIAEYRSSILGIPPFARTSHYEHPVPSPSEVATVSGNEELDNADNNRLHASSSPQLPSSTSDSITATASTLIDHDHLFITFPKYLQKKPIARQAYVVHMAENLAHLSVPERTALCKDVTYLRHTQDGRYAKASNKALRTLHEKRELLTPKMQFLVNRAYQYLLQRIS